MDLLFIAGRRGAVGMAGGYFDNRPKKGNQAIGDSECRLHNKKAQTPLHVHTRTHKKGKRMNNRIKNKIQEMQEWTAGAPTEQSVCL